MEFLQELPVTRHGERPLLPRIWDLREKLTAYDGACVALAEALGCPLVTFDAALASGHRLSAEIVVLPAVPPITPRD